jgi:uncharacterized protein DUF3237
VPEGAPRLEFLMAISAEVGGTIGLEPGPLGERRMVSITGGTFEGPRLRGTVMGGATGRSCAATVRSSSMPAMRCTTRAAAWCRW